MSLPKVLVTLHLPSVQLARLWEHCEVVEPNTRFPIPREEFLSLVPGVKGILCTAKDIVDSSLLDTAGPQLCCISTMSAGYEHLSIPDCRAHSVCVGHTPGVLSDSVAEINIGLALAVMRGVGGDRVKSGGWARAQNRDLFQGLGESLVGKVCGILGLGGIGLTTAHTLRAFKVGRILYCARREHEEAKEVGAERVSLDDLASQSDIVFVCASLNTSTEGIISKSFLARMKSSSYLVNTSRGGLVDQEALLEALNTGTIRGAGLDVMEPEPLPPSHPLAMCDKVVLTPHIGTATTHTREAMAQLAVDNLLAGLRGENMPAPIH